MAGGISKHRRDLQGTGGLEGNAVARLWRAGWCGTCVNGTCHSPGHFSLSCVSPCGEKGGLGSGPRERTTVGDGRGGASPPGRLVEELQDTTEVRHHCTVVYKAWGHHCGTPSCLPPWPPCATIGAHTYIGSHAPPGRVAHLLRP